MAEFKGLKKDEHEKLTRAAAMYTNLTGEKLDVGQIPVAPEESEDPKAKAKTAAAELERSAEVTRKLEEAAREERRIRAHQHDPIETEAAAASKTAKRSGKSKGKKEDPEGVYEPAEPVFPNE